MPGRYDNVLQTIGGTPVVRINRLGPPQANLYVKLEAFNPLGSVKDRLALGVIEDAEATGQLEPGQTVVEATSGRAGCTRASVLSRIIRERARRSGADVPSLAHGSADRRD